MMDMVQQGGPKSAGKKPSKRKRSNAKAALVREHVDLLVRQEDEYQPKSSSHYQSHPSVV